MKQTGQRIRNMRKALGLTQVEFAQKIEVDQSTVSDIENGKGFSAEILIRMVKCLGGSAELIVTGSDPRVWPFPRIPIERFLALDQEQRAHVEGRLAEILEGMESPTDDDLAQFNANRTSIIRRRKPPSSRHA